jgi:transcriptional regulator with XRE-family HTH domain
MISKLLGQRLSREGYIRSKLNQVIPSQIRALRLREGWTQDQLGAEAEMKQARISAMESPGEVNFSLKTLIRLAAAFNVGLWVEFVSHSEMLRRENSFSQDHFHPVRLPDDHTFLHPAIATSSEQLGNGMSPLIVSIDGFSTESINGNTGRSMYLDNYSVATQDHGYEPAAMGAM